MHQIQKMSQQKVNQLQHVYDPFSDVCCLCGFFFSVLFLLRNAPAMVARRLLGWICVGVYVDVYDGAADGQAAV